MESSRRDLHNALLCTDLKAHCKHFARLAKISRIFWQKIEIAELCKGVHYVDLDETFQTHICLQKLASKQPRTSPVKFARSSGAAGSDPERFPGSRRCSGWLLSDLALGFATRPVCTASQHVEQRHSRPGPYLARAGIGG